jgi:hypothetical protein
MTGAGFGFGVYALATALAAPVRDDDAGRSEHHEIVVPLGRTQIFTWWPRDAAVTVRSNGARAEVYGGPGSLWWTPAEDHRRTLVFDADRPIGLVAWSEDSNALAPAWTRHLRDVERACEGRAAPPSPPAGAGGLGLYVDALVRAVPDRPRLCAAAAEVAAEAWRDRSSAEHRRTLDASYRIGPGDVVRLDAVGPGVVVVRARPEIAGGGQGTIDLVAMVDGRIRERLHRHSTDDPERDGVGFVRELVVPIPEGPHRVALIAEVGAAWIDVVAESLRPSWRRPRPEQAFGGRLEGAALLTAVAAQGSPEAASIAATLTDPDPSTADLAAAARIHDAPSTDVPAAVGPFSAYVLAHRREVLRDVPGAALAASPPGWVVDPELTALVADAIDPEAVRPRDVAVRRAAGAVVAGAIGARWTSLYPEGDVEVRRADAARGGQTRVRVEAGHDAVIAVPDLDDGLGVLALEADAPARYRIDGRARFGAGALDEAVPAGDHVVLVDQGTVWLRDGLLARGGTPTREVPTTAVPATFPLPEPGFPGRVSIAIHAGGPVVVGADDGATWRLEPSPEPALLTIGPHASRLVVEGPAGTVISAAMQTSNDLSPPPLPDVGPDPLDVIARTSRALVAGEGRAATLRLERASALVALDLVGMARRDLVAVSELPDATPRERAAAAARLAPKLTLDAPGALTAEAALARIGEPPPDPDVGAAWADAATAVPPSEAPLLYRRAAERFLEVGEPVEAWSAAAAGGDATLDVQRRVESAGRWRRIGAVDVHGGVVTNTLLRVPPGPDDPVVARVREALLGAPWPAESYAVLRGGRRDRLSVDGSGALDVSLLCRDEELAAAPPPCVVHVEVDGRYERLEIPDQTIRSVRIDLERGAHEVVIDPVGDGATALVARLEWRGEVIPPRLDATAHRLGGGGLRTTVAGPALLRVTVTAGAPARVRVGDVDVTVSDEAVVPVRAAGATLLRVDGPAETQVALARWEPLPEALRPTPLPPPPRYVAPPADGPGVPAAAALVAESLRRPEPPGVPPGPPGTLRVHLGVSDESIGVRDTVTHFPTLEAGGAGFVRLRSDLWASVWGRARVGRPGVGVGVGARGVLRSGAWTTVVAPEAFASPGAAHASVDVDVARSYRLGPDLNLEPWVGVDAGWWTPDAPLDVDPLVWTVFATQHPASVSVGADATLRPFSDARLRARTSATSNAGASLDRSSVSVRGDALLSDGAVLSAVVELGQRYKDADRSAFALRPLVGADLLVVGWATRRDRVAVDATVRYLPLVGAVEGGVMVSWELSAARGLLDHAPSDLVFGSALDLPAERRRVEGP